MSHSVHVASLAQRVARYHQSLRENGLTVRSIHIRVRHTEPVAWTVKEVVHRVGCRSVIPQDLTVLTLPQSLEMLGRLRVDPSRRDPSNAIAQCSSHWTLPDLATMSRSPWGLTSMEDHTLAVSDGCSRVSLLAAGRLA